MAMVALPFQFIYMPFLASVLSLSKKFTKILDKINTLKSSHFPSYKKNSLEFAKHESNAQ